MPAQLTRDDVTRIAALAQLELTPDEVDLFARQLTGILDHAGQLQAIDTTGIEPMTGVQTGPGPERTDDPQPSLAVADALANAPDQAPDAGLFRVPKVIGA